VYHQETIFDSTETIMSAMKEVSGYPGKIHLGKVSGFDPEKPVEDIIVRRKLIGHEYGGGKTDSAGCTRTLLYLFLLLLALHSYLYASICRPKGLSIVALVIPIFIFICTRMIFSYDICANMYYFHQQKQTP
jgi:hypothetical protein